MKYSGFGFRCNDGYDGKIYENFIEFTMNNNLLDKLTVLPTIYSSFSGVIFYDFDLLGSSYERKYLGEDKTFQWGNSDTALIIRGDDLAGTIRTYPPGTTSVRDPDPYIISKLNTETKVFIKVYDGVQKSKFEYSFFTAKYNRTDESIKLYQFYATDKWRINRKLEEIEGYELNCKKLSEDKVKENLIKIESQRENNLIKRKEELEEKERKKQEELDSIAF